MTKVIISFILGFLVATIGLSGIVGFVDEKVEEAKEAISK